MCDAARARSRIWRSPAPSALFAPASRPRAGVHALAAIAADARMGADVSVGPFVAIGEGASIGDRTVMYPERDDRCRRDASASDCVIHSNVVDSRARARSAIAWYCRTASSSAATATASCAAATARTKRSRRSPSSSSKTTWSSARIRPWIVRRSAKRVSGAAPRSTTSCRSRHGVTVGRNVLMAAQVGIAGSTDIEDDVVFGGQVGVGGHLTHRTGSMAVGQSGVTNSLDAGAFVSPGIRRSTAATWRKASVRLPPAAGAEDAASRSSKRAWLSSMGARANRRRPSDR